MIPVEFTWAELVALHEEDFASPDYLAAQRKIEQARAIEEGSCGAHPTTTEATV